MGISLYNYLIFSKLLSNVGGSHVIIGTIEGLLQMFTERGVGPLRGLNALILDDVYTTFHDELLLAKLVDLVVLIYNQVENPGEY